MFCRIRLPWNSTGTARGFPCDRVRNPNCNPKLDMLKVFVRSFHFWKKDRYAPASSFKRYFCQALIDGDVLALRGAASMRGWAFLRLVAAGASTKTPTSSHAYSTVCDSISLLFRRRCSTSTPSWSFVIRFHQLASPGARRAQAAVSPPGGRFTAVAERSRSGSSTRSPAGDRSRRGNDRRGCRTYSTTMMT